MMAHYYGKAIWPLITCDLRLLSMIHFNYMFELIATVTYMYIENIEYYIIRNCTRVVQLESHSCILGMAQLHSQNAMAAQLESHSYIVGIPWLHSQNVIVAQLESHSCIVRMPWLHSWNAMVEWLELHGCLFIIAWMHSFHDMSCDSNSNYMPMGIAWPYIWKPMAAISRLLHYAAFCSMRTVSTLAVLEIRSERDYMALSYQ